MRSVLTFVITLSLLLPGQSSAYRLSGQKWPRAEATFVFDIIDTEGRSQAPSGKSWNEAFREALERWSNRTGFVFDSIEGISPNPCNDDDLNTAAFRLDDCGFDFGSSTLAITYSVFSRGILKETDILFNGNEPWDVYEGPLRHSTDFTRVAVHELGHALGLDHEDSVPSIMSSLVGDLTVPQLDDVLGIQALYGDSIDMPDPCEVSRLPINSAIEGRLALSDCRRADIATTPQGSDDSLVDLYELEMPVAGLIVIRMMSDTLDSYLEVRDESGKTIIASDDDSGTGLNAFLPVRLEKGRYRVVVNTAFSWAESGDYTVQALIWHKGESPVRLNEDWSITIDVVEYAGRYYQASLIRHTPDADAAGLYWRLASATLLSPQPASLIPGALVSPDSQDLIFNPIAGLGKQYDSVLQRYHDPDQPGKWIWKLESAVPRP